MGLLQPWKGEWWSLPAQHRESAESWNSEAVLIPPYSSEGEAVFPAHQGEPCLLEQKEASRIQQEMSWWGNWDMLGHGLSWEERLFQPVFLLTCSFSITHIHIRASLLCESEGVSMWLAGMFLRAVPTSGCLAITKLYAKVNLSMEICPIKSRLNKFRPNSFFLYLDPKIVLRHPQTTSIGESGMKGGGYHGKRQEA